MSTRAEDEIRDYLAKNLDCIEDGMVLINKEEYLPTRPDQSEK
jgi:RecB family endonuclease NucS